MRFVSRFLSVVVLTAVTSSNLQAQRFGAQISWGEDSDVGLGVRGEWDFANRLTTTGAFSRAFIVGQFDYYFQDCPAGADCSYWELNPSLAIPFSGTNFKPYAGAGLHLGHGSSDTELGINVLGGLKFTIGGMDAFSEARLGIGGSHEQLALSFGVLFGRSTPGRGR